MTLEQAKALKYRQIVHQGTCHVKVGPRGGLTLTCREYRVTGAVKLWKTRPNEVRVPVARGLYEHDVIANLPGLCTLPDFHLESECLALAEYRELCTSRYRLSRPDDELTLPELREKVLLELTQVTTEVDR